MFNEKYKNAFLRMKNVSDKSIVVYENYFIITEKYERELGKDLFEMSNDEIKSMLENVGKSTVRAVTSFVALLREYIEWSIMVGLSEDYERTVLTNMRFDNMEKFVSKERITYYTRDDILNGLDKLVNVRERALVLSVFEGLSGKLFVEIRNLKIGDLYKIEGRCYAELMFDEVDLLYRKMEISNELYDLLVECYNTKIYYGNSYDTHLDDSKYIFRTTTKGSGALDDRISIATIRSLFTKEIKSAYDDNINPKLVKLSGEMDYINKLMLVEYANNKYQSERVLDKMVLREVNIKYSNASTIISGDEHYSLVKTRERYDFNAIRDMYGDFKVNI